MNCHVKRYSKQRPADNRTCEDLSSGIIALSLVASRVNYYKLIDLSTHGTGCFEYWRRFMLN